jgi:integrase
MADYSPFHKTVKGKSGKEVVRWYYSYTTNDGKRKQGACKKCKTKAEAEAFISKLEPIRRTDFPIRMITCNMFVPESDHYNHRKQLGKSVKPITITTKRRYVELIERVFGDSDIRDIGVQDVIDYLKDQAKSGSWKNGFIETFDEVFAWAQWKKIKVLTPEFPRFIRNSKKSDILDTDELSRFFRPENFETEDFYVMFRVSVSGGMRLSEARAFRPCQFYKEQQAIIIDGFLDAKQKRLPYNKKGTEESPKLRVAIMPKTTCDILADFIERMKRKDSDLLFLFDEKAIRKEYAEEVFERSAVKAGIKLPRIPQKKIIEMKHRGIDTSAYERKITPHSLRYTYVTRMRRNLDGETVQKMVGHTDIEMTDEYTRAALGESIKALQPAIPAADLFFV